MTVLTLKYAPKTSSEILGNEDKVNRIRYFLNNFKEHKQKAILIHGPIGVGKTCTVYALAQEFDLDLIEINSSNLRNKSSMDNFLRSTLGQQSLFFKQKVVLIDELDNFSGMKDRGGLQELAKAIDRTNFPLIFTGNDISSSKFKAIRNKSLLLEFEKLGHLEIFDFLKDICVKENVNFEERALKSLARQVDGDLRAALIDLQTLISVGEIRFSDVVNLSDRKRTDSILKALNLIFKSSSADNSIRAFDNVDIDKDIIMLWLDENLPREYVDPVSLSKAYENFSRADIFNNRIMRRQHWRFLVYIYNLLSAGISSSKIERNSDMVNYRQPMRLLKIWQAKMKNSKKKEISLKLSENTHCSTKEASKKIELLKHLVRNNVAQEAIKEFNFSDEEVQWLMNS